MTKQRIATETATGNRYLVDRICFRTGVVHCYREIANVKTDISTGRLIKYAYQGGALKFASADVRIEEVELTSTVVTELLAQAARNTNMIVRTRKVR